MFILDGNQVPNLKKSLKKIATSKAEKKGFQSLLAVWDIHKKYIYFIHNIINCSLLFSLNFEYSHNKSNNQLLIFIRAENKKMERKKYHS